MQYTNSRQYNPSCSQHLRRPHFRAFSNRSWLRLRLHSHQPLRRRMCTPQPPRLLCRNRLSIRLSIRNLHSFLVRLRNVLPYLPLQHRLARLKRHPNPHRLHLHNPLLLVPRISTLALGKTSRDPRALTSHSCQATIRDRHR